MTPAVVPSGVPEGNAVYDEARNRLVLVSYGTRLVTWEWDGTTWTERTPAVSPPRARAAMAYDAARGVTVIFGGSNARNDTWEWNGTTWTERSPATVPPAAPSAMVYDSVRRRTVLFGAAGTWEWDGVDWTARTSALTPPP